MFTSLLSKVFWEHVKLGIERFNNMLQLQLSFLWSRAILYSDVLKENKFHLKSVADFLDGTKIRLSGGLNQNQVVVFSGHNRIHCFVNQPLSTIDGAIFALFGPMKGRPHDLTFLRQCA